MLCLATTMRVRRRERGENVSEAITDFKAALGIYSADVTPAARDQHVLQCLAVPS